MRVADFDFALPEELIAQAPITPRDAARLLVLPPAGPVDHRRIAELPELLAPGDLLVFNDTRVIPARLVGQKRSSGGRAELLLVEPLAGELGRRWRALGQGSRGLRAGALLQFGALEARVEAALGDGFYDVAFELEGAALEAALAREGRIPLPPYIRRDPGPEDAERYQTIFARAPGSAAAPTAGLHFTPELFERLSARGVERTSLTLHVGPGTFLPFRGETFEGHRMHEERYEVPEAAAEAVARCRAGGHRVIAVGTTAVRTLESAWKDGKVVPGGGRTSLFVRPGHSFNAVDGLVTNFHLPRSTLLVLVSAFGGRERVLGAYEEAVRCRYRFFSFGDAMFLTARAPRTAPAP